MESIRPKLSVILPAYNESRQILATLRETISVLDAKNLLFELIVVADGDDGTRELVSEFSRNGEPRVKVLGEKARRGKGRGVREGVAIAEGELIGFVDADNKTPPSEVYAFLTELEKGVDVVIGSRKLAQSVIQVPQKLYRRIGSKIFNFLMKLAFNFDDISDTQCGFKFFNRKVADSIFNRMKVDGYMFDIEFLYLVKKEGFVLRQLPVIWRDDSDTRMRMISGNLKNAFELLKLRLWTIH